MSRLNTHVGLLTEAADTAGDAGEDQTSDTRVANLV